MNLDELKKLLKENLVIDVKPCEKYGPNNSVEIGLRFVGEEHPFCYEHIYIPESGLD